MKAKLLSDFSEKCKKGTEIEIDKILFDEKYVGKFKVRVIDGLSGDCKYLAINWIVKIPDGRYP
jgi:hypothetical protein